MTTSKPVKRRVSLTMCTMPHFADPCIEWRKAHPMRYYNLATYLNDRRVSGDSDYGGSVIHVTNVNTVDVLRALNIPEEIIEQIPFENDKEI